MMQPEFDEKLGKAYVETLHELANGTDQWVDVSEWHKWTLNHMEGRMLVVLDAHSTAGKLFARTTPKGRKAAENGTLPPIVPMADPIPQPLPHRNEAGEEETTDDAQGEGRMCTVAGCDEPCKENTYRGGYYSRCEEHQKAYWRAQAKEKRGKKLTDLEREARIRPVVSGDEAMTERVMAVLEERMNEHHVNGWTTIPVVGDHPCEGCRHYKVLALLRALFPEIEETAALLELAEEARVRLGL